MIVSLTSNAILVFCFFWFNVRRKILDSAHRATWAWMWSGWEAGMVWGGRIQEGSFLLINIISHAEQPCVLVDCTHYYPPPRYSTSPHTPPPLPLNFIPHNICRNLLNLRNNYQRLSLACNIWISYNFISHNFLNNFSLILYTTFF